MRHHRSHHPCFLEPINYLLKRKHRTIGKGKSPLSIHEKNRERKMTKAIVTDFVRKIHLCVLSEFVFHMSTDSSLKSRDKLMEK
mmetsp:Transcript_13207/g.33264  ORF Transcript_13207/g.33264 Transcript_13207/m.33264 type:complete len:84 (+) Transcript_13207:2317-2568(+)